MTLIESDAVINGGAMKVFDYGLIAEDKCDLIIAAAERIKGRLKRQTSDIIAIGHDLLKVKEVVGHGNFLPWVSAEFNWTARTAQNYIRAAEWAGEKYEVVSHLPPTLVYALSDKRTPETIQVQVRADLAAGKPLDVAAVKEKISDARWQAEQQKKHEAPTGRRRPAVSEATRRRREREEQKQQEEHARREAERETAAVKAVDILRKLSADDLADLCVLLRVASPFRVRELLDQANGGDHE